MRSFSKHGAKLPIIRYVTRLARYGRWDHSPCTGGYGERHHEEPMTRDNKESMVSMTCSASRERRII